MLKHREIRHSVLIRARMRAGGPACEVCVRNVSTRGMLLQACRPPAPGSYVEIMLPETSVAARVVWASDRRFGVAARERLRLSDFVASAGAPAKPDARTAGRAAAALVVQRKDRALGIGRSMQFVFLLLCGLAAAAFAGSVAFGMLGTLRDTLVSHL